VLTESILKKLYGDNKQELMRQKKRYQQLSLKYEQLFKKEQVVIFSTPGRTEISGNHTDHNHGKVLAGSINLDSIAAAAKANDNIVTLYSEGYEKPFIVDLKNLTIIENEKGTTESLIRGVASRLVELGYKIGGFNAMISSDVLPGSGLSSSASIEVLIGTIFNSLYNKNKISAEILAKTGQFAENNFFGKPCGLMDQMACAMGGIITIDFKNPQEPITEKIEYNLDRQNFSLLVVNTKGNHEDLTDDYSAIPSEMKAVAAEFGKDVCRDIKMSELLPRIETIRLKLGDRAVLRVIHFLLENERVSEQVTALKKNDFEKFLSLVKDSGDSSFKWLQNIFTVNNVREQGVSLGLALSEYYIKQIAKGACRVHGGGFAGTIQVFLPKDKIEGYRNLIEPIFGKDSIYILNIRKYGTVDIADL
jgi:galactokinase